MEQGRAQPGGQTELPAISAHTQLVGVMGWPVEHSLSPAMHNAALQHLGLDWRYVALPVHPSRVQDAVRGVVALGFRGANVTVPHKRAVMAALDEIAPEASALGAVNTLVVRRTDDHVTLVGRNTDVAGFLGSLRSGGFEPNKSGRAVVVGAGGAARAVIYGLVKAGMEAVTILNRTVARAHRLIEDLQPTLGNSESLEALELTDDRLVAETEGADLLVNATTVGMWPVIDHSVWPAETSMPDHLTVYDLVYNPLETRLLRQATESGARAIDGLGMLARQGALALAFWMDEPFDVDGVTALMRQAALRASSAVETEPERYDSRMESRGPAAPRQ